MFDSQTYVMNSKTNVEGGAELSQLHRHRQRKTWLNPQITMADIDVNPYELLDVKLEATEQEIRTAYRQRSLKVHPDRVCKPFIPR